MRVVEYAGHGAGIASAYAGWLLSRLGAQVTRWTTEPQSAPRSSSPLQQTLDVLAADKNTVPCPSIMTELEQRLADCDILLCDAPLEFAALAASLESLAASKPDLVIGVATVFGLDGPYADYPGTALDAQALSGVAWSLGEPDREPLSLPPGIVEHQGGVMLAAGCLLGLQIRDGLGTGRVVDIALADILASYVATNCRVFIHHGLSWHRGGRRASGSGGAYPYVILPCKDGEVCIFGRTPEEWARLVAAMGNPQWAAEPRYQNLRAMGQEYPQEVDRLLMPWLARHTKAELEAIALEHNLIVSPIREISEVLKTRQFGERDFFYTADAANQRVTVPGLPFRVSESRSAAAVNIAPKLLSGPALEASDTAPPDTARPLAGIRVVDFGWVWSAPWVSTMLAELGAEVIKVEHGKRPDNLRLSGRVIRDGKKVEGPSKEMSPMFHQVNHGKLGITLNTKEPRAVELLKRLVKISDVVVENMSPGTMERTHLGYDALREVNPQIVMLAMSAAGQFGSLSNMRAYAPNMSSAAGLESLVGYRNESPIGALGFGLGDPNASAHAVTAVLAGLRRAGATGEGCYIDLSQIEALVATLRPYVIDSQIKARQCPTLGNAHPDMAPHGIYPAKGSDRWLTLVVQNDAQWQDLKTMAAEEPWTRFTQYDSNAGRLAHVETLDAEIARWTARHPRDELVNRLRATGIASSPVLSVEELWNDPHFAARQIKHAVHIPVYGDEDLFRAPWRFSDFAPTIDACGPLTGQHNEQVFGDLLGLSSEEIQELCDDGVIA